MSVSINLLPDTRVTKQRDHKRRQLIGGIAVAVWVVCGGLVLLLVVSLASEKLVINKLTHDISDKEQQLENTDGLIDALTAQQDLSSLSTLYSQRVRISKFLAAYTASNPTGVSLTAMELDPTNILTVTGNATSYVNVAKLAKALSVQAGASSTPNFTGVSISTVSRADSTVSFTLTANMTQGVTSGN